MQQIPIDIIIIALIAGFILLRLRSVLGQKNGMEDPPEFLEKPQNADTPVVQIPGLRQRADAKDEDQAFIDALADSSVKEGVLAIRAADTQFSVQHFLTGAKAAFEMLLNAFNQGDRKTLKMLLSDPLYKMFDEELSKREQAEHKTVSTLAAIVSAELVGAQLERNTARVTVKFLSEQITLTRDASGAIIEGNPSHTERVEDEWRFERTINARTPDWKIIET